MWLRGCTLSASRSPKHCAADGPLRPQLRRVHSRWPVPVPRALAGGLFACGTFFLELVGASIWYALVCTRDKRSTQPREVPVLTVCVRCARAKAGGRAHRRCHHHCRPRRRIFRCRRRRYGRPRSTCSLWCVAWLDMVWPHPLLGLFLCAGFGA